MSRLFRWHHSAYAVIAAFSALAASAEAPEENAPAPDGAVEISYSEASEIRPGEGWLIDCGTIGALSGVVITCAPDGVTLASEGFDPKWGEQALPVTLISGAAAIDVTYRVRLEAPPVPEVAVTRLDIPIPVGAQAMVPISALAISCAECSVAGGATLEIGALPPGLSAGVSDTHLTVRSAASGDVIVPLTVTDDAGQSTPVELTASFVETPEQAVAAVHIVSAARQWDLRELAWGTGLTAVCASTQSIGMTCANDGTAQLTADQGQLMFRVVDSDGQQAWGSVTFDATATSDHLAVPSWAKDAPLSMVSVPVETVDGPADAPLTALALLLEGIPRS